MCNILGEERGVFCFGGSVQHIIWQKQTYAHMGALCSVEINSEGLGVHKKLGPKVYPTAPIHR